MQQVPTVVKANGKPVHRGVVDRQYDNLRAIIQMFVTDKQEARRLPSPSVSFHAFYTHRRCVSFAFIQPWCMVTYNSQTASTMPRRRILSSARPRRSSGTTRTSYSTSSNMISHRSEGSLALMCATPLAACVYTTYS